jgi:pentatricopeptide repeat protein
LQQEQQVSLNVGKHKKKGNKREKLWQEFFSDPSQWWDNRFEKGNAKYPDFKHKTTQAALWLDNQQNPAWVEPELAKMAPGIIQLHSFSWTRMLTRYVKAGQYEKMMELFQQMQQAGMSPNGFTFLPVLNACTSLRAIVEGRCVHEEIIQSGYESDVVVGLIDMYAKCESMEDAHRVFNRMPTWNVTLGLL